MYDYSLLSIIYTTRMAESVSFYERLGLQRKLAGAVDQWWNEFVIGDAALALHWHQGDDAPAPTQSELHLRLDAAAFNSLYDALSPDQSLVIHELRGVGRYIVLTDPNGVRVQINEVI